MKFAQPIPEEVRVTLQEMHMNHPMFHCRHRAQAILLISLETDAQVIKR